MSIPINTPESLVKPSNDENDTIIKMTPPLIIPNILIEVSLDKIPTRNNAKPTRRSIKESNGTCVVICMVPHDEPRKNERTM